MRRYLKQAKTIDGINLPRGTFGNVIKVDKDRICQFETMYGTFFIEKCYLTSNKPNLNK